ncbi:acyltransferase family protein [bacterium]|nr:acyltransferase family protein [bacterium]
MASLLGRALLKAIERTGKTPDELAYRVLPRFILEVLERYLRVTTQGVGNLPRKGPYILIANHSGFMGFDALMLTHQVAKARKKVPHIIAHKLWFFTPEISVHAHRFGLVPATYENGLAILQRGEPLILFPEGEEGNFKPSSKRYHLRRFRRGFMRLALETGVPIVPAVVIGAEETHLTLSQIRAAKPLIGTIIPVPLNVIPLPAKWKIRFLKPIRIEKKPEKAKDQAFVTAQSRKIRLQLQKELSKEVKKRQKVFL